jgi:hypothetical protein
LRRVGATDRASTSELGPSNTVDCVKEAEPFTLGDERHGDARAIISWCHDLCFKVD